MIEKIFIVLIKILKNNKMTTKIDQNNSTSKPSTLSNIKNMMKIGSDKLKEKVIFSLT
jgi:hypothetical protein